MAFTIGPFIVATKQERENKELMNHEKIHLAQWSELYYVGFLICYYCHSFYLLCRYFSVRLAYRLNMFEAEAFAHQKDAGYLKNRAKFAWNKHDLSVDLFLEKQKKYVPDQADRVTAAVIILSVILVLSFLICL